MKKLLAVLLMLTGSMLGQAARYDSQALTTSTIQGSSGVVKTVPNATVTVCNYPAATFAACVKAPLCTEVTMSSCSTSGNPLTADSRGNFGFWIASGKYDYWITTSSGSVGPYPITVQGDAGVFTSVTAQTIAAGTTCPVGTSPGTACAPLDPALPPVIPTSINLSPQNNLASKQYADSIRIVEGREYLSSLHKQMMITGNSVTVLFSGDSTTNGDFATAPYRIDEVVQKIANQRGVRAVVSRSGHSGSNSGQWLSTYLAQDMATPPNAYVIRWGLNDFQTGVLSPALTISNIRSGLATIRATRPVSLLSIVLMMPNSVDDAAGGRPLSYFQQLYSGLRQAARDYQCVFIDTSGFLPDMRDGSGSSDWINNDYGGSGRHVHPLNVMNAWIGSLVADVLFPSSLSSGVANTYYPTSAHASADTPDTYEEGISIHPAVNGGPPNWPVQGLVETTHQTSSGSHYAMQKLFSSGSYSPIAFRTFAGAVGVAAWSAWTYSAAGTTIAPVALTLQNSWANFGSGSASASVRMDAGVVRLSGLIKGGATTSLATIANIPVGMRPTETRWFTVAFAPTANTNGNALVVVTNAGDVQIYSVSSAGNYFLSLDSIQFIP